MNEKERYKQAFNALHPSEGFSERLMASINEADERKDTVMKKENKGSKRVTKKFIAVIAAVFVLILGAITAYAANVGGIQRTIQIWAMGEKTDAVLVVNNNDRYSEYTLSYTDADGVTHEKNGGGVAIDAFGRERPLTEEEIMDDIDFPDVRIDDDGTATVSWRSQVLDITDKFDENGVCYVRVTDETKTYYITVELDSDGSGYHVSIDNKKYR